MSTKPKQKLSPRPAAEVMQEIKRIEDAIAELTRSMNDAGRGLADTVRLSVCQRELKAYLLGIRYTLGEREFTP